MFKPYQFNGLNAFFNKTPHDIVNARIIVGSGAYDEAAPNIYGVAHYLEHMFFKGTTKHSYKEINNLTSLYGDINAYTSRYVTVYHFSFLASNFQKAMDVLAEMVYEPSFPEDEFEKERGVILQEYQTYKDNPSGFFWDHLGNSLYDAPHGHPIIGTKESITRLTIDDVRNFHRGNYFNSGNVIVAVTGNLEEKDFIKYFTDKNLAKDYTRKPRASQQAPIFNTDMDHFHHKSDQAIMAMCFKGHSVTQVIQNNFACSLLFNALGQGMHSLLFDRIREELGLCYSVGAANNADLTYGTSTIYCQLDEKQVDFAVDEINKVLAKVKAEGISDKLLEVAKSNMLFDWANAVQTSKGINKQVDQYFELYPQWQVDNLELFNNMNDLKYVQTAVNALTNDDLIPVARDIFDQPYKLSKMTHG